MGLRMVLQLSADFQALRLFYKLSKLSVSKDNKWSLDHLLERNQKSVIVPQNIVVLLKQANVVP